MVKNTAKARRDLKAGHASAVLDDKHVRNCRVLPDRDALLERLPHGRVVAEIGVAFGEFTDSILEINKPSNLHLIDAWATPRYEAGLESVRTRFAGELESGQLEIHRGRSTEVLESLPDATFDWMYIDTDHSFLTTRAELELCRQKLKKGGRIAGHDFTTGNSVKPWPYGVIEACNEFCVNSHWEFEFLTLESHGHFSFALREI